MKVKEFIEKLRNLSPNELDLNIEFRFNGLSHEVSSISRSFEMKENEQSDLLVIDFKKNKPEIVYRS